jgi:hypothetical protein
MGKYYNFSLKSFTIIIASGIEPSRYTGVTQVFVSPILNPFLSNPAFVMQHLHFPKVYLLILDYHVTIVIALTCSDSLDHWYAFLQTFEERKLYFNVINNIFIGRQKAPILTIDFANVEKYTSISVIKQPCSSPAPAPVLQAFQNHASSTNRRNYIFLRLLFQLTTLLSTHTKTPSVINRIPPPVSVAIFCCALQVFSYFQGRCACK